MAHNAWASEIVKKSGVRIPIGLVGGVYDPAVAEEVLAKGQADYVLMGPFAMADPELVKKAKEAGKTTSAPACAATTAWITAAASPYPGICTCLPIPATTVSA